MLNNFKKQPIWQKALNIVLGTLLLTYLSYAVYYLIGSFTTTDHICTLDRFSCSANDRLFAAFGNFFLLGLILIFTFVLNGVIRVVRSKRKPSGHKL